MNEIALSFFAQVRGIVEFTPSISALEVGGGEIKGTPFFKKEKKILKLQKISLILFDTRLDVQLQH